MVNYRALLIILSVGLLIFFTKAYSSVTSQPQAPFIVDLESEKNTAWPNGSFVFVKKTSSTYVLSGTTFTYTGDGKVKINKPFDQLFQNGTMADVSYSSFPVQAGSTYYFNFVTLFQSTATVTGIKIGLTTPAFSTFSAKARIPVAADGTAGEFQGWITSSGDSVTGTGVQAINTTYVVDTQGIICPSANGILQLQSAGELTISSVTVKAGSYGWIESIP